MYSAIQGRSLKEAPDSALIEAICTRLEKMAAYFGRNSGVDADDLKQEAWIAVLEALPGLDRSIGEPDQYLLKRARWRMMDVIRSSRRRTCLSLMEEGANEAVFDPPFHFDLSALICRLTPLQQRILKMLLEGYTWRETGDFLGCTSANIAYHVRRIRALYLKMEES